MVMHPWIKKFMKSPELQQTPFSKAVCRPCKTKFAFPYIGDMDHGILYFCGEEGTVFGFFEPLDHPIWNYIERTINENFAENLDSKDFNIGIRVQWVTAQCADTIDNQKFTPETTCPQCKSSDIELYHDEFVEYRDIPRVSFHKFESLSELAKGNKIRSLYSMSKNKYPPLLCSRSVLEKSVDLLGYLLFWPIRWFMNLRNKNA